MQRAARRRGRIEGPVPVRCASAGSPAAVAASVEDRDVSVAEIIQATACARVTGRLGVERGRRRGFVAFLAGEIVDAALGELAGEHAFRAILALRAGRASFASGEVGRTRTIHKSWQQLLLESQWRLEEAERGRDRPEQTGSSAPGGAGVTGRLRRIPGVACAIARRAGDARSEDEGGSAAMLARETRYLAAYGKQLGAALGAGELTSAAVQGRESHLLFLSGSDFSLGVLVDAGRELAAAESAIREAVEATNHGYEP
jgi:Domain of unknown function (DUF4388)